MMLASMAEVQTIMTAKPKSKRSALQRIGQGWFLTARQDRLFHLVIIDDESGRIDEGMVVTRHVVHHVFLRTDSTELLQLIKRGKLILFVFIINFSPVFTSIR